MSIDIGPFQGDQPSPEPGKPDDPCKAEYHAVQDAAGNQIQTPKTRQLFGRKPFLREEWDKST